MTIESQKGIAPLSIEQIEQLEGLGNVDPNQLFGLDMETGWDKLPPHAKSYYIVGRALSGEPVDSWGDLGAYHSFKKPEFKDFGSITQGLPLEEKGKFLSILKLYLQDLQGRAKQLMAGDQRTAADIINSNQRQDLGTAIALETIGFAQEWVSSLINSAKPSDEANVVQPESCELESSAAAKVPQERVSSFRALLPDWLKKLLN